MDEKGTGVAQTFANNSKDTDCQNRLQATTFNQRDSPRMNVCVCFLIGDKLLFEFN